MPLQRATFIRVIVSKLIFSYLDILPALKGTGIPDVTQERVVSHDDTLVSAADGMTAPFTSQTSPAYPAVEKRLHSRFLAWLSQVNRKMMEKIYYEFN